MSLRQHIKTAIRAWQRERKSAPKASYTRDEHDFQPGYLEIVERPPVPWARRTALALTLLLVIGLIWSIVGRLDIHANATGRLLVSSHSKIIQSLEAGEIQRIRVRDGQRVKAGEVLIDLNPIGVEAEWKELEAQLRYRQLERARLEALLTDTPLEEYQPPANISPSQAELAKAHLRSVWNEVLANLASIDGEMAVNRANQQARSDDIQSLERLSANIQTRLQARTALAEHKLLPKIELLEQEKERLELERSLSQQHADMAVLKAEYQSLVERRESFLAKTRREYYDKLNSVRSEIAVMKQQLIKVGEKQRLQRLRAPVDGVVQQLAVHTKGGVVQPAQQLMVIVPDDALLEADVMVLNKDIGFVHAGQSVEIKIDSFPYTRYGTISGKVGHVSKDAVKDEQLGLVFPTRIQLSRSTIAVEDQTIPLQAGMSTTAEIRTGQRRVIEYLLSPLQQYQSEALRER
ncbi:HlyD family type I secretion periplasmic adaptor subunit [Vibrio coralliilyticus]|uniref:HlyD family type I secretion periplasmic adaptor subunit n=1 Tax=Vibrio coralliilyticus TaxID=190893 RepID=UPI000BAB0016|nr:HlyD family type I secretion periplasmic adaptor subunit [Vibrio coralliilyticus]NOI77364.1 HlyD family type I secretion periplasmic adaptor subunit [Vibrio coralliilyticus]PAU36385.1 hemolysin D [Vibrio coralliilyticus]PAW02875.1 hemolysin D [Vibrio coralliilyticus]